MSASVASSGRHRRRTAPSLSMHGPVQREEPSVSADQGAMLNDDDALLRDALAFIGDLDFDLDDGTPDEDDELTRFLTDVPDDLPPPSAPLELALPLGSMVSLAEPGPTESLMGVESSLRTMPAAESSEKQAEATSTKPKTINRARTRRRDELAYLRGLVGGLEERLTSLKSTQEESASASPSAAEPSEESAALVDAWAQLASRQYAQRQRAETENTKLKQMLQEQIQVGKSLERLLRRKRPNLETIQPEFASEKRPRRSSSRAWNNELVFDELLADCAALYAETDRELTRYGAPPAKPLRDVQLVHDPELGMMVQTVDHRILPFSYEDTVREVWKAFPEVSTVHPAHAYHDVDLTDDRMKLQFRVTAEIGRMRGEFSVKVVVRRYVEADRTVIVTSGIVDPSEISQTNMAGVRMRQKGWHIIERMPASPSLPLGASRILIHLRAVPDVDDELRDQTRKVGTLTNFLLSTISLEMESRSQRVDNRLFELSLKNGSGVV